MARREFVFNGFDFSSATQFLNGREPYRLIIEKYDGPLLPVEMSSPPKPSTSDKGPPQPSPENDPPNEPGPSRPSEETPPQPSTSNPRSANSTVENFFLYDLDCFARQFNRAKWREFIAITKDKGPSYSELSIDDPIPDDVATFVLDRRDQYCPPPVRIESPRPWAPIPVAVNQPVASTSRAESEPTLILLDEEQPPNPDANLISIRDTSNSTSDSKENTFAQVPEGRNDEDGSKLNPDQASTSSIHVQHIDNAMNSKHSCSQAVSSIEDDSLRHTIRDFVFHSDSSDDSIQILSETINSDSDGQPTPLLQTSLPDEIPSETPSRYQDQFPDDLVLQLSARVHVLNILDVMDDIERPAQELDQIHSRHTDDLFSGDIHFHHRYVRDLGDGSVQSVQRDPSQISRSIAVEEVVDDVVKNLMADVLQEVVQNVVQSVMKDAEQDAEPEVTEVAVQVAAEVAEEATGEAFEIDAEVNAEVEPEIVAEEAAKEEDTETAEEGADSDDEDDVETEEEIEDGDKETGNESDEEELSSPLTTDPEPSDDVIVTGDSMEDTTDENTPPNARKQKFCVIKQNRKRKLVKVLETGDSDENGALIIEISYELPTGLAEQETTDEKSPSKSPEKNSSSSDKGQKDDAIAESELSAPEPSSPEPFTEEMGSESTEVNLMKKTIQDTSWSESSKESQSTSSAEKSSDRNRPSTYSGYRGKSRSAPPRRKKRGRKRKEISPEVPEPAMEVEVYAQGTDRRSPSPPKSKIKTPSPDHIIHDLSASHSEPEEKPKPYLRRTRGPGRPAATAPVSSASSTLSSPSRAKTWTSPRKLKSKFVSLLSSKTSTDSSSKESTKSPTPASQIPSEPGTSRRPITFIPSEPGPSGVTRTSRISGLRSRSPITFIPSQPTSSVVAATSKISELRSRTSRGSNLLIPSKPGPSGMSRTTKLSESSPSGTSRKSQAATKRPSPSEKGQSTSKIGSSPPKKSKRKVRFKLAQTSDTPSRIVTRSSSSSSQSPPQDTPGPTRGKKSSLKKSSEPQPGRTRSSRRSRPKPEEEDQESDQSGPSPRKRGRGRPPKPK